MSDKKTTVDDLKKKLLDYRRKRGWKGEDPKDVAISLLLESSELLEHFQWMTGEEVEKESRLYGPICDELADVLWWVLVMAERLDIDVSQAFERKLKKNEKKYPAESFSEDKSVEEKRRAYYDIKAKHRGGHPLAEEN
ncbi:MazG-like family protein [Patescibacteria group bacterium]